MYLSQMYLSKYKKCITFYLLFLCVTFCHELSPGLCVFLCLDIPLNECSLGALSMFVAFFLISKSTQLFSFQ